jgi:hypothetical protein
MGNSITALLTATTTTTTTTNGGIVRGSYMGYALGKVGKGRTIAVGCQEDAGTNEGKGNEGGLAGPLLNIPMPWATAGAVGIAIIAVLCVATV